MSEQEKCHSMGKATLSLPVAMDKERFVAPMRNTEEEKGEQKEE